MCKNETCYEESLKTGQLCSPAFSSGNPSPNMKNYFLIFVGLCIIMVFEPALMLPKRKLFFTNLAFSTKTQNIIIWSYSRLLFIIIFSIPTLYLTINGASKFNFCLVNINEQICKNYQTELDCLKEKTDFSALVEINGKTKCTFTTNLDYYISEYDRGIDANSPNNIVLINGIIPEYHNYLSFGSPQKWTKSFQWINSTKLGIANSKLEKITENGKLVQGNKTTIIIFTTSTKLKLEFNGTSLSNLIKKDELTNYSSLIIPFYNSAYIITFPEITGTIQIIRFWS